MDKTKLMQRLMATFLEELEEHVRAFNQDLLAVEKGAQGAERTQRLASLFRTVHSLKGASRAVNMSVIESACHRLEEILAALRDESPGREVFALLFAAGDAIEEAGMRLREQHDLSGAPLAALLPRLEAATGRGEAAAPAPAPAPPARQPAAVIEPPPEIASAGSSVRVAAGRLDTLLARIGELLVARRRVESRVTDLAELYEYVEQWKKEWQRVERAFGKALQPGSSEEEHFALDGIPRRALAVLGQTRDRLRHMGKELERLMAAVIGDGRLLRQITGPLHDEVRNVRMLPFAEACQGLDRMVRDLAQAADKEVDLAIEGGNVELDRSVLECLKDPLRHLVRNAVDHGAERAAQRLLSGKPPRARITIAASLRGSQVEVAVQDDGNGLDMEALREQTRRRRLPEPASEYELARVIFLPGLSTSPIITDVSGRGVGLDVVKDRVESLHGTVDVSSKAGAGTRFTLTVPLTLTTMRAVLVRAGGQTFALAGTCVERLVSVKPDDIRFVAARPMLSLSGVPLPLAPLAAILGLSAPPPDAAPKRTPVLIVAVGEKRMALAVEDFLAEQVIVVNTLGPRIRRLHLVSGATLLASGRIALVLNAASVVRRALGQMPVPATAAAEPAAAGAVRKRLLVVDDSVTTRTLEKSILEAAGYEVITAADGLAAWQLLQEQGADLLVSDVEMPRMDGYTLTETVRASRQFHALPVILVTARESDQDKARGIAVGADAYLLKSGFDQRNLLETIAQLL